MEPSVHHSAVGEASRGDEGERLQARLRAARAAKAAAEKERAESRAFSNWINLQTQVNCFMDSSKDPSASSAALAANIPPGIRQLLEKKEGIFRK